MTVPNRKKHLQDGTQFPMVPVAVSALLPNVALVDSIGNGWFSFSSAASGTPLNTTVQIPSALTSANNENDEIARTTTAGKEGVLVPPGKYRITVVVGVGPGAAGGGTPGTFRVAVTKTDPVSGNTGTGDTPTVFVTGAVKVPDDAGGSLSSNLGIIERVMTGVYSLPRVGTIDFAGLTGPPAPVTGLNSAGQWLLQVRVAQTTTGGSALALKYGHLYIEKIGVADPS